MARGMKAVAAGAAGLVGGALAARRGRGGRQATGGDVQAVTVVARQDEVGRRWEAHAADAGLPPVEIEVRAAPGDRGTELRARLAGGEEPSDGGGESADAGDSGDGAETPQQRLREELRRFKSLVECGTVVSTEGQPSGRGPAQGAITRGVTDRLRAWGAA